APGAAAAQMVEAIVLDQNRIFPCAAYLTGEYDIDGLYIGVPVKLGNGGIKDIIQIELNDDERKLLDASADHVRKTYSDLDRIMKK
ncbi:MAG TPA: hypothetical protein VKA34_15275, partial [Balneolales bacterium]|nr:hypothetical protein [Balneolales bacterium]